MKEQNKVLNAGVVGCGNISTVYLDNLTGRFPFVRVTACFDTNAELRNEKAEMYKLKAYKTYEELLNSKDIDVVICLTPLSSHYSVCKGALLHNKHAYTEKTVTAVYEETKKLIKIAEEKNLFYGCSTDTFMGAGLQTAKKLLRDNTAGEPLSCVIRMSHRGIEAWHPRPDFCYKKEGGGPDYGMGSYYFTNLTELFGSVVSVTGLSKTSFPSRYVMTGEDKGREIKVEVPTHLTGSVLFESGVICTYIFSYEIGPIKIPHFEIYTTKGTIEASDPNDFGGKITFCRNDSEEWEEVLHVDGFSDNARGIGISEMCRCILEGKKTNTNFANSLRGAHIMEVLEGIRTSCKEGRKVDIRSRIKPCEMFDYSSFINK